MPTKTSELENDSGFLTEHQDISGKLDKDKLPEAIDDALAQAKESGEFNGKDGAPGEKGDKGDPGEITYVENPYDDTEIKKEIATKVGYSEVVGNQLLMYADDTKEKLLATLELPSGVEDVQINGESIVENGIAEIPMMGTGKSGLIQFKGGYGLQLIGNYLLVKGATETEITNRTGSRLSICADRTLDYAVKTAMCDGKGAAWTEEEQASARERIGIPTDWQLVDDITIEKAVVKIAIDTDYSQYNEIMIQTMLQPNENNVLVKVISSNNPNTVNPWQSNITLLEAPKTTDKTVYSITILERNNLGIFVKKQLASANTHSVSANLIPTVAYYYTQAVPHDINGNKISTNVIADDFEIICSQPQTSFKYLTIGSYKEAIAPGSKFKIYAR